MFIQIVFNRLLIYMRINLHINLKLIRLFLYMTKLKQGLC